MSLAVHISKMHSQEYPYRIFVNGKGQAVRIRKS